MTVLSTHSLSLSFGDKEILKDISFSLNEGDRLGVVGVNGAGKTTLFRLLTGEYTSTSGEVFLAKERTVGVLRQDEAANLTLGERTLFDYVLLSALHPSSIDLRHAKCYIRVPCPYFCIVLSD